MNVNDSLFETPTRNATSRFKNRGNGVSSFVLPGNTKSPSQRLKDLFFATYTGGGADSQSSQKTTRSRDSILTSASLQTPTKTPGTDQGSSLVNPDDLMDVDSPVAQRTQPHREADESHMSEEDLKGPAVPLAISTSGRFYSEHMRRCELRIELMGLSTMGHNPRGVYVMPSLGSINKWHGVMFIKRGYWNNAVVRFCIDIPREYPSAHPVITLMTRVSHPLVRLEDGRFALEQQFPQWTPYSDYIFHALHYLKNAFKNRVLKQLQPRDCYNISAYMKFKNDLPQFREHARIDSLQSRHPNALYGSQPPDCPIVFTQLSEDQFESTMQQIKSFVAVANPPVAA
ncbi:hypothetical protein LPJ77_001959 [Coemansia sp. RSA 2523]|nr:hypothetical protein LPJ54_001584 [Coemansia sp. RSA 1824]KAJ1809004.1 hypothetical protein LPJ77_001959 [Coemansia sp. RSA 2523]KAJ2151212.1 hypothetical protein J3F82_003490 [Coemansia sp. RSA 637]KAJ2427131.1 hypothetical protein GGF47_001893 [Coemansia sp. RSA 2524]KAJ2528906.1 hypothetical protein IWW43_005173 [Coemansia sp. RSA 1935]